MLHLTQTFRESLHGCDLRVPKWYGILRQVGGWSMWMDLQTESARQKTQPLSCHCVSSVESHFFPARMSVSSWVLGVLHFMQASRLSIQLPLTISLPSPSSLNRFLTVNLVCSSMRLYGQWKWYDNSLRIFLSWRSFACTCRLSELMTSAFLSRDCVSHFRARAA